MKKVVAVVLIGVLALAAPTAVGAGKAKRYKGNFDSGGSLKFKVKKRNGNRKVIKFEFSAFPVNCDSGAQTHSGDLPFALPVNKRNKFRANAYLGNDPSNPKSQLKLRGKLVGARKAKGTMKVDGSRLPVDSGGKAVCTSPRTDWSARRT